MGGFNEILARTTKQSEYGYGVRQLYGMGISASFSQLAGQWVSGDSKFGKNEIMGALAAGAMQGTYSYALQSLGKKYEKSIGPVAFNLVAFAVSPMVHDLFQSFMPFAKYSNNKTASESTNRLSSILGAFDGYPKKLEDNIRAVSENTFTFGRGWSGVKYELGYTPDYYLKLHEFIRTADKVGFQNAYNSYLASNLHVRYGY